MFANSLFSLPDPTKFRSWRWSEGEITRDVDHNYTNLWNEQTLPRLHQYPLLAEDHQHGGMGDLGRRTLGTTTSLRQQSAFMAD